MQVKTAVKNFIDSDREIFVQVEKGGSFFLVSKDKDFVSEYGSIIAESKVKRIDTEESEEAVTIYL